MLERLKRLFAPKQRASEVEIEARRPTGEGPAVVPVGPPTSGPAPVVPLGERPTDEPDQPPR